MVCGILVPQTDFKPASPALQGRFLTTGPPGQSLDVLFYVEKPDFCVLLHCMFRSLLLVKMHFMKSGFFIVDPELSLNHAFFSLFILFSSSVSQTNSLI